MVFEIALLEDGAVVRRKEVKLAAFIMEAATAFDVDPIRAKVIVFNSLIPTIADDIEYDVLHILGKFARQETNDRSEKPLTTCGFHPAADIIIDQLIDRQIQEDEA
ncbi:MAG: hypothetical protein HPY45_09845 [Anaerolineae bacterium]|nr:hypothetical protein [Anaerolineae bacterium]